MIEALWLVIALPLVGFTINLFFGKRIGQPLAGWVAFGFVALAWIVALVPRVGVFHCTRSKTAFDRHGIAAT